MWGIWKKKMLSDFDRRRNDRGSRKWPHIMFQNQVSSGQRRTGAEVELSDYQRLPSGDDELSPRNLLQGESRKIEVIADLDTFFERLYKYYCGKGIWCITIQWVIELLSLGFTICFSGFFLLIFDWKLLHTCGVNATEPCDLAKEAIKEHPLTPFTFIKGIVVAYLALFSLYWVFCFLRFFVQLREILEVRYFYHQSLGVSDRELQTSSWPVLLDKIVKLQQHQRLCVVRDLSAHDVVMRIMRRQNYLIGMLNKGVLAVPLPVWLPGSGPVVNHGRDYTVKRRLVLTKTLEWSLNWCILQQMFDKNFLIRREFIDNPKTLRRRFMSVGLLMLLLSPFLIIFMFVYFFLRHAEEFYHHPNTATSRRWSNLAKWIFRELNEMDHMFSQRLNSSYKHAVEYMKQFPSVILSQLAKFIAFVSGGFAAILLILALLDESLLEAHLFGRNLFWYAAVFGTITAISRSAISEEFQVYEPEKCLRLVSCFTHYMPKHWRGSENKDSVRAEFESLFQYTGMTLLEDLISIFVTPYTLFFLLPKYVDDVLQFIKEFTVRIDGVGDVCSLGVFDFERHGNRNYGSPVHTNKSKRSSQGKMEKSFVSFQTSYPHWEPDNNGKRFLSILADFRVRSAESQITNSSCQFVRPGISTMENGMFSLLMQPGYGFKWPLSCNTSNHEQVQSGQLREDLFLCGNTLTADQLYWLVDKFYTTHSSQIAHREVTDAQDINQEAAVHLSYFSDIPETSRKNSMVYGKADGHSGLPVRSAYVHDLEANRNLNTSMCSTSMVQKDEHMDTVIYSGSSGHAVIDHMNRSRSPLLRQASILPKRDDWWPQVQQDQPTTMGPGSFLEPPMYGVGHFAGSSYESSLESEDFQERTWESMHSRRPYASSVLEEKVSDFELPFGDVYDASEGPSAGHLPTS